MLIKALRLRLPGLISRCVSHRILPFEMGASPHHRIFRDRWQNGVPQGFNQKVQYKLIHDRRALISMSADKVAVRDYVRSKAPLLKLPKLLGVYDSEADVLANVPSGPWVMKG